MLCAHVLGATTYSPEPPGTACMSAWEPNGVVLQLPNAKVTARHEGHSHTLVNLVHFHLPRATLSMPAIPQSECMATGSKNADQHPGTVDKAKKTTKQG